MGMSLCPAPDGVSPQALGRSGEAIVLKLLSKALVIEVLHVGVAVGKPEHHTCYCFLLQCEMLQAWLSSITIHLDYYNTFELLQEIQQLTV